MGLCRWAVSVEPKLALLDYNGGFALDVANFEAPHRVLEYLLGILILRALATLLDVEIHTYIIRLFAVRLILLLTRSFLKGFFLWLITFGSRVFSWIIFGLLSIYRPSSVSGSFLVSDSAMSLFRTRTLILLGSLMTLVVGLTFSTKLSRAKTS